MHAHEQNIRLHRTNTTRRRPDVRMRALSVHCVERRNVARASDDPSRIDFAFAYLPSPRNLTSSCVCVCTRRVHRLARLMRLLWSQSTLDGGRMRMRMRMMTWQASAVESVLRSPRTLARRVVRFALCPLYPSFPAHSSSRGDACYLSQHKNSTRNCLLFLLVLPAARRDGSIDLFVFSEQNNKLFPDNKSFYYIYRSSSYNLTTSQNDL